jgi:Peptidase family M48
MIRKLLVLLLLTLAALAATAQVPAPPVPAAAQAVPLDPVAATRAWIDTTPAGQRAKTDAYFEGGYWLLLWGARWGVRGVADTAGLPILVAAFTVFQLLATPLNKTLTRVQEIEADQFGLAAGRNPDADAAVILKLGEYRKMEPGPIEEFIFYTHPSGWRRIKNAMRWKAEQQRQAAPAVAR